jgi:hypothetical protein
MVAVVAKVADPVRQAIIRKSRVSVNGLQDAPQALLVGKTPPETQMAATAPAPQPL